MNNDICWLITILQCNQLIRVALKVKQSHVSEDMVKFPMEPENLKLINKLLPNHLKDYGPIVQVEELFDIHIREIYHFR
jgi:hypothetical protein